MGVVIINACAHAMHERAKLISFAHHAGTIITRTKVRYILATVISTVSRTYFFQQGNKLNSRQEHNESNIYKKVAKSISYKSP